MNLTSRSFASLMARNLLAVLATFAGVGMAEAQQSFFMGLGDLPGGISFSEPKDISADGSVIMGIISTQNGSSEFFRWTRDAGMKGLGTLDGGQPRLSADGSTIVGSYYPNSSTSARIFRWTNQEGFVQLPLSAARAVSGDGSVVVGYIQQQVALWTKTNGIQTGLLADPAPSTGVDISADGSVILGMQGTGQADGRYFIWSAAEGATYWPAVNWNSPPPVISDNGNVVVGSDQFPNPTGAWRWTKETGVVPFGLMPDGKGTALGQVVSADGSIIIGEVEGDTAGAIGVPWGQGFGRGIPRKPFIWDEVHGPRYLFDVLRNDYGLGSALAGWKDVSIIAGVSGDGRTITGLGVNPNGYGEAWVAYLGAPVPEPSTMAIGVLALAHVLWRGHGRSSCAVATGRHAPRTNPALKNVSTSPPRPTAESFNRTRERPSPTRPDKHLKQSGMPL